MDVTQLKAQYTSLGGLIASLEAASNLKQPDIDRVTAEVATVSGDALAILQSVPPIPVGLDYTKFDAAVVAFKADGKLSQADVDAVANLLSRNTP